MPTHELVQESTDPQVIVQGRYKKGKTSDVIVFRLTILLIELVCIVTVPVEGEIYAPVYIKFKIKKGS